MGKAKKPTAPTRATTKPVARKPTTKTAAKPRDKKQPAKPVVASSSSSSSIIAETPSLEQLLRKVGARDEELEARIINALSEQGLVDLGANYASSSIYETVPAVVDSLRTQWSTLDDARRANLAGFDPALLAGIVARSLTLRDLARQGEDSSTDGARARLKREARYRAVAGEAMGLRDRTYTGVRELLAQESPERTSWEAAVGTAEDSDALGRGLANLATELRVLLGDEAHRGVLAKVRFTEKTADALERNAAAVRAAGDAVRQVNSDPKVIQRELDLEDGKVLRLLQATYRVWKEAAKSDARLRLPPLGPLTRLVQRVEAKGDGEPKGE